MKSKFNPVEPSVTPNKINREKRIPIPIENKIKKIITFSIEYNVLAESIVIKLSFNDNKYIKIIVKQ